MTQSCKFESAAVKSEFRNLPTKRTITSFVFGQVQVDWKMSDQKHVQLHVFFKHVMLHVARSRQDALVVSSTRFCCHMMFATEPTKVLFVQEDHKSITTSLNRLQASGNSATVHLCLLNHCVLYCQLADRSSRRSMSRKKGAPLLHNKLKSTKALLCMYNDITKASRKCKGYVCRLKRTNLHFFSLHASVLKQQGSLCKELCDLARSIDYGFRRSPLCCCFLLHDHRRCRDLTGKQVLEIGEQWKSLPACSHAPRMAYRRWRAPKRP